MFAGVERFLVEILRAKDDRFLGPFTLAQLTSVILVAIGIWVLAKLQEGAEPGAGRLSDHWQEGGTAKNLDSCAKLALHQWLRDGSPTAVKGLVAPRGALSPAGSSVKLSIIQRLAISCTDGTTLAYTRRGRSLAASARKW